MQLLRSFLLYFIFHFAYNGPNNTLNVFANKIFKLPPNYLIYHRKFIKSQNFIDLLKNILHYRQGGTKIHAVYEL